MKTYIRNYPSISAFARHVESLGDDRQHGANNSSTSDNGYKWTMGQTLPEALEMGLSGGNWEQGARDLQKVDIDTMAHGIADVIEPAIIHGVTGGALDIGEYLANNPECWMLLEETEQAKPIVRVGACVVPSASVTAAELMNRGRAIIALVEALELQQYSVELVALWCTKHRNDKITYISETVVKQAGEPWIPSSVAYAFAHTGFSRRLGFRALESDADCYTITNVGYGRGDIEAPKGYDLYFPYLSDGDRTATPDMALEYILSQATKQQPNLIKGAH